MESFSTLTNEQLADEISTWSGRIAAGEARLLTMIGEFDRREAWAGPGLLSCAHWLTWRTGLGLTAARERVRVAARLTELPQVQAAFAAGRMSWSQVRAITRVAAPDDGIDWVDLARHASGAQMEKICRGLRRAIKISEDEADPELADYRLRTRTRYDVDGNLVITIYANAEDGAVIRAGLQAVVRDLERRRAAETEVGEPAAPSEGDSAEARSGSTTDAPSTPRDHDSAESRSAHPARITEADALLEMTRRALETEQAEHPDIARRNRSALTPQVDPLSGWGRLRNGEILPPTSLKTSLTALPGRPGLRPLTPTDLTRHDLGRTSRAVSLPLRELLGTLDGERCRFPGCTRHRALHAHHVRYWSDGGPTDLANLVLLCNRHHTLVHQLGFRLDLHPDRRLEVSSADGVPVLHHPAPWADPAALDPERQITEDTLPATHCEARLDLGYVVHVLRQQAA